MSRIHAVIQNRRIEIAATSDLPDGTRVMVEILSADDKIGLDESEWSNDPKALADWAAWLNSVRPEGPILTAQAAGLG